MHIVVSAEICSAGYQVFHNQTSLLTPKKTNEKSFSEAFQEFLKPKSVTEYFLMSSNLQ